MTETYKVSCLVFLSSIIYIFSLSGEFVFDDSEAVVRNVNLDLTTPIYAIFKNDFWGVDIKSNASHKSYRPLTVLSFRLNKIFSGNKLVPLHFKITNLLLHIVVTILLYLILQILISGNVSNEGEKKYVVENKDVRSKVSENKQAWTCDAFLTSVLFAVHPIHVEAVSGIVGRADILAALFFFLSILFYNKSVAKSEKCQNLNHTRKKYYDKKWLWFFLSLVCSSTAMFCKETGITSLAVCSIYDIVIVKKMDPVNIYVFIKKVFNNKFTIKSSSGDEQTSVCNDWGGFATAFLKSNMDFFIRQILSVIFLLFFLYTRWAVMDFSRPKFQETDNPTSFSPEISTRILSYNYIYFLNLLILVWPSWLCFDWSMGCIPLIKTFSDPRIIFVMVFWCYIAGIVLRILNGTIHPKNRRLFVMAVSLMIVPFTPASNMLMPVGFVIAERILYIPSAGFCLLVVYGFKKLRKHSSSSWQKKLKFAFVMLVLCLSLKTIKRSAEWQQERPLFESALRVCPLNAKIHYNVAKGAVDRNELVLAETYYRSAMALYPRYYHAMNNLANLLKDQSRYFEAENLLRRAIELKVDFPAAWMNLGIVLSRLKQPEAAEHAYLEALKYRSRYADCFYNLGNLYQEQNKPEWAMKSWKEATEINSKHSMAWSNMLTLLDNSGQIFRGLELADLAMAAVPHSGAIHLNIGNLLGKNFDYVAAEMHFLEAIDLMGKDVQAINYGNLGILYHRWNKPDKAMIMYKKALKINPNLKSAAENMKSLMTN